MISTYCDDAVIYQSISMWNRYVMKEILETVPQTPQERKSLTAPP